MELWIRNQDRDRLVKNYAYIDIFDPCMEDEQYTTRHIYAYINESNQVFLGEYNTPERALEVLDEIQNILKPIIINKQIKSDGMLADGLSDGVLHTYNVNEIRELSTYVYEMPKE